MTTTYRLSDDESGESFADYRAVLASDWLWVAHRIVAVEGGVERDGVEDIAHFWLRENDPEVEPVPPVLEQAIEDELYSNLKARAVAMRGVA